MNNEAKVFDDPQVYDLGLLPEDLSSTYSKAEKMYHDGKKKFFSLMRKIRSHSRELMYHLEDECNCQDGEESHPVIAHSVGILKQFDDCLSEGDTRGAELLRELLLALHAGKAAESMKYGAFDYMKANNWEQHVTPCSWAIFDKKKKRWRIFTGSEEEADKMLRDVECHYCGKKHEKLPGGPDDVMTAISMLKKLKERLEEGKTTDD